MSEFFSNLGATLVEIFSKPTNVIALITLLLLLIALFKFRKVKLTTKMMTQVGLAIALAAVLNLFKLFSLPMGGSVTLGSMVPIFLIAFIYGPEVGLFTGFVYGIIDLMLGGSVVHPIQLLLDYPLAYMMIGLAGFFGKDLTYTKRIMGVLIGVLFRFMCHFLSGVIFFGSYAIEQGKNPYINSLVYNGSFLSLDAAICLVFIILLPIDQFISMAKKRSIKSI